MLNLKQKFDNYIIQKAVKITSKRFESMYYNIFNSKINGVKDIADSIYLDMNEDDVEVLYVYYTDLDGFIIDCTKRKGSVEQVNVHIRDILREGLLCNASGLILAHTHLAQSHEPSDADLLLTHDLIKSAGALGIAVYDHIIVSKQGWTSFEEDGYMKAIHAELDDDQEQKDKEAEEQLEGK